VEQVGVRELRSNLAAALRQAGAGERVVVTVDGRPVAQLGPLDAADAPSLEALAASGLVEPPRRRDRPPDPEATDTAVDLRLDRVLAEVRGA
jgi:prevent-host-death family protein